MTESQAPEPLSDASAPRDVPSYLREVASALADPEASVERVLAAAGSRVGDRGKRDVRFAPAEPRFSFGAVKIGSASAPSDQPSSVTLITAEGAEPVRVMDVAAVFGTWRRLVAGTSAYMAWQVTFATKYRRPGVTSGPGGVVVGAILSGDPDAADTAVREVVLRRDFDG